jgi:hypothetical protein
MIPNLTLSVRKEVLTRTKKLAASLLLGTALFVAPVSSVAAQTTVGDGLINVAVGDITITDVADIGVAAQVAANICGVKVGPVAVLGRAVDRTGAPRTVCTTDQGPVTLTNN